MPELVERLWEGSGYGARRDRRPGRENHRYTTVRKLRRKRRQAVELVLSRTIDDGKVAALDIAALFKTLTERCDVRFAKLA